MALEGFNKEYYLNAKLEALQADPATSAEWQGRDTAALESLLRSDYGLTPEQHYVRYGYQEDLAPNAYFDADEYVRAKAQSMVENDGYANVADARAAFESAWQGTPYQHYLQYGASEGINPSNDFDASAYYQEKLADLQSDPETSAAWAGATVEDVKASLSEAGLTPLGHFIEYGRQEGLTAPDVPAAEAVSVEGAWAEIPESRVLTVQGSSEMPTYFQASDLAATGDHAEYQAIRFVGVNGQQVTLDGLPHRKWVFVDSSDMTLNLNGTEAGHVKLEGSTVTLLGDTVNQGTETNPDYVATGLMTSLTMAVAAGDSASSLDLAGSATAGLMKVNLEGDGDLDVSGNAMVEGAVVDAAFLSGDLTVADGVLDDASSVTLGSGDDILTIDDASAADGSAAILAGGAGADTLIFSSNVQVPADAPDTATTVQADVSGFEDVTFNGYSEIDARDFGNANLTFDSGASVDHLDGDRTVTAVADGISTGQNDGHSPLLLNDPGSTVNVVARQDANDPSQVLDLKVVSNSEEDDAGNASSTLHLSGKADVAYEVNSDEIGTFDAW